MNRKLIATFLAFSALAACSSEKKPSGEPPASAFNGEFTPCGHGCQNAPFYRGSSRMIPFYPADPNNAAASLRLALEEANAEGGTVILATDGTTIMNGLFVLKSAVIAARANNITIANSTFYRESIYSGSAMQKL